MCSQQLQKKNYLQCGRRQAQNKVYLPSALFSEDSLEITLNFANEKVECPTPTLVEEQSHHRHIDLIELIALIGLLDLSGVRKKCFIPV